MSWSTFWPLYLTHPIESAMIPVSQEGRQTGVRIMANSLSEVITDLQHAREKAAMRVAEASAELQKIDDALRGLQSDVVLSPTSFRQKDMMELGIVAAAKKLLQERGELTTREIADELLDRGVKTESERFVPNVYATLANAKATFVRHGKKWSLKKGAQA